MDYRVKDIGLAGEGRLKVEWAERHMPVLMRIREEYSRSRPLSGLRIGACLHVTKETAVLVKTLKAGGAEVYLCASNPLSTQDDVAAFLLEESIDVYAWRGNHKQYYWCIDRVLDIEPDVTMDDGADLVVRIHTKRKELIKKVYAGTEETTTGVNRFVSMERSGELKYPIIAVNNAATKWDFDNVYGTGQSTIDGILRATNILLAGKKFVVCGYGHCGRGIAMRARGMGAHVIVTEVDPVKALRAILDGFEVMPMKKAAQIGDIFVTATGDKDVIRKEHFEVMKNGAILANAGHFNVEISIPDLEKLSIGKKTVRENVEEYTLRDNRKLYLLAEGRLVNLAAAEGHPSEVMDMSFANQALCAKYLVENKGKLKPGVYDVPKDVDDQVAKLKLQTLGVEIDELTPEQVQYLRGWEFGT